MVGDIETSPADVQATFCATLVDEWVRLGVAEAAMALARLERNGWLREVSGWFEFAGDEASSI